jgi:hypothetical protein
MPQFLRSRIVGVSALAVLASTLLYGPVGAVQPTTQVLYVAQGGNDSSNTCGTPSEPCATIGHALSESGISSVIDVAAGTYHEHGLVVTGTVDIEGAGQSTTVIDAGGLEQIMLVQPGGSLTLRGVTLRNGRSPAHAGAVENSGTLALIGDRFVDNRAVDPGGAITNYTRISSMVNDRFVDNTDQGIGGAIANFGSIQAASGDAFTDNFAENTAGAVENQGTIDSLDGSLFSMNKAGYAGAIDNSGQIGDLSKDTFWANNVFGFGGALNNVFGSITSVTDDTFVANSVSDGLGQGGAIEQDEGTISTLADDTITGNSATIGGGIDNEEGSTIGGISGVIVALNTGTQGPNCYNFGGHLFDAGHNLTDDSGATCGFSARDHDLVGVSPELQGLGAYGGKALTDPPLRGSPVVNAGPSVTCPTATDQRGVPRPQAPGGACDIGAVELAPPDPTSLAPSTGPVSGGTGVRIIGSGFTLATGVTFGQTPVRFRVVNDGTITLVAPPGQGSEPVRITTPDGRSGGGLAFIYSS